MSRGGLYVWRTRKPHALLGLPIIGRHFAYDGMTGSFYHREGQHLNGSEQYKKAAASWSDLDPKCWTIPLPDWLFRGPLRRKFVEKLESCLIGITCPVYNERQQPRWNFRKISRKKAAEQRALRDKMTLGSRLTYSVLASLVRWTIFITIGLLVYFVGMEMQ